jgi:nucleotide-binding universal stress UspA family protein
MNAEEQVIAHTTDLGGEDGLAFVHAAALAAASGARLVTIHGNAPPEVASRLPAAAPLAARWGRAIDHERRCHECCDDVTDTVLDALRRLAPALVVAGTHARHGFRAFLHESVSAALSRNLEVPTLIVPNHGRGFVEEATGAIDLRRVLVPAEDAATAEVGVNAARRLCAMAGARAPELIVLHVGDGNIVPPNAGGLAVHVRYVRGRLEHEIREVAREDRACAIVMATRGHDGMLDALLGSHTEHVIHGAACPVLVAPMSRRHAVLEA